MKKIYLLLIFVGLICLSFTSGIQAQSNTPQRQETKALQKIEGLRVYPNPATGDILYITSYLQLTKTVQIYTVLGKKVMYKVLIGKELDISNLNPGVYVIKITEGKNQDTQKLIID
ncbi:T9SS type A sorting domain-containing protein [Aquimarina sp. D1M17]|uniref:T9SS type A sorting domain-containing protein n=1 Tax=Aquimarina acroporae TaxID=2937283 RepID=UPI0020BE776E|nr:T9SS type A sorting domain-containing protein [Aquimarina acroporae]MCK8520897.1 T9SS type A sorting domain-containing protein [Aquimarina acroporae]